VRDINTRAGRTVSVNLGAPFFIVADFLIQQVTISFPQTPGKLFPLFSVQASSIRFTFEDFLRAIRKAA